MGFSVYYRSTRPVDQATADTIDRASAALCHGRTWLGCEPVHFFPDQSDDHLFGASKPNFQPHPDDAASAAKSGLPNGTTRDLLDVLCRLSRDHGVDWEIGHDHSNGPVGRIWGGVCDAAVLAQIDAFADLGDLLGGLEDDLEIPENGHPPSAPPGDEWDEDGPSILPFKPRGE